LSEKVIILWFYINTKYSYVPSAARLLLMLPMFFKCCFHFKENC
jgi:hypothetical protein